MHLKKHLNHFPSYKMELREDINLDNIQELLAHLEGEDRL